MNKLDFVKIDIQNSLFTLSAPAEYFLTNISGGNIGEDNTFTGSRIEELKTSKVRYANFLYDLYSFLDSVDVNFSPEIKENTKIKIDGIVSADEVFDYIIPFNMHGKPFYMGILKDPHSSSIFYVVVDKKSGLPYLRVKSNSSFNEKLNFKDILSEVFSLYPSGSILFHHYADNIFQRVQVASYIGNEKNEKVLDAVDISVATEEIANSMQNASVKDLTVWGVSITDEKMYNLIKKITKDFTIVPTRMDEKTKVTLYKIMSMYLFGYSTSILNDVIFSDFIKEHPEDSYSFVRCKDTLLFTYILTFLEETRHKKEYSRYIATADREGVRNLIKGGYSAFNNKLNMFFPISVEDKNVKYQYFNGIKYDLIGFNRNFRNNDNRKFYLFMSDVIKVPFFSSLIITRKDLPFYIPRYKDDVKKYLGIFKSKLNELRSIYYEKDI